MNAQTIGWFIFLSLIKNFSHAERKLFTLKDSHLTATEGSCAELKCEVTAAVHITGAYWFWLKNAFWNVSYYSGTVISSTNNSTHPVSPDFAARVTYIGSPSLSWQHYNQYPPKSCSILFCELKKTDSGNYSFRFVGTSATDTWITKPPLILTVQDNPCPITFETPPAVNESDMISLTCSTLNSCRSDLQIQNMTQQPATLLSPSSQTAEPKKSITVNFTANWLDDGRRFSCQTKENKDTYLIRNINLTVKYAPKDMQVKNPPTDIKEGVNVTLNCSAKGRPVPTFTWLKNGQTQASEAEWRIPSIKDSQSGEYWCEATNTHGTIRSDPVNIDVIYAPKVEVKMTPPASTVKERDKITLTCNVTRSNPKPHSFIWLKNGRNVGSKQTFVFESIESENSGSYTCTATNSVGPGNSEPFPISVEYGPRHTNISSENGLRVRIDNSLTLNCDTDANPAPTKYSWYRYKKNEQIDSSQWTSKTVTESYLDLGKVQRTDKACYTCNATNDINTGWNSGEACIEVLYPPTNLKLSMDAEVTEGQLITISCTVESFPPSRLELKWPSGKSLLSLPDTDKPSSTIQHKFNVTSAHAGFYTCTASNAEGMDSTERKLVVKYRPTDVKVEAEPGFTVNENTSLTLQCRALSHPPVTSFTWMKKTDGKPQNLAQKIQAITLKSVSPSDSGVYSCAAANEIGTGFSKQVDVKVKYGPRHAKIVRAAEQQYSSGRSSVKLSCSSLSYPDTKYSWHRKTEAENRDEEISQRQNYTVFSDEPGIYYCIAKNEMGSRSSDSVSLFVDRGLWRALKISFICLITLLIIALLIYVYRNKRNKSTHQGIINTLPCFGFLGYGISARRRNLRNQPVMAEPFRSRDDLLPNQPCRLNGQQREPRPDNTPASNINTVYSTVNMPTGKQGPSAKKQTRQQRGHNEDESLNYASIHFENKQKNKHTDVEETMVYAKVKKKKQPKKNEEGKLPDYENVNAAQAAKPPNSSDSDSETSEDDEVEVNYSQVSFKAKPGHQRAGRHVSRDSSSETSSDSSTSDEEETQYSIVKT